MFAMSLDEKTKKIDPKTLVTLQTRDKTLTVAYATVQKIPVLDAMYLRWYHNEGPLLIDSPSEVIESVIDEVAPVTREYLLGLPEEKNKHLAQSPYEYAMKHNLNTIVSTKWIVIECNSRRMKIIQDRGSWYYVINYSTHEYYPFHNMAAADVNDSISKLFDEISVFEYFFM